ncbi:MAG: hydroxyacylglutathione hydrolase [Cyanobacteria bacterium P01_F01_bin.150]
MRIYCLPALSDNYIFILEDEQAQIAAVVDPADARPVLDWLRANNRILTTIFNTHHHGDHVGGNRQLLQAFPNALVYGGKKDKGRIPNQHFFLEEGDRVSFGDRTAQVYFVPGHTRGHIAYYFPPKHDASRKTEPGDLFCGDTLFAGGCGRLFEGTPAQMVESMEKLRSLPDSTRVWCGHEYTLNNLKFALTVDSENPQLQQRFIDVQRDRQYRIPTIPSTIGIEKQTNPFFRWDQPALQDCTGHTKPARTFGKLRGMKDLF